MLDELGNVHSKLGWLIAMEEEAGGNDKDAIRVGRHISSLQERILQPPTAVPSAGDYPREQLKSSDHIVRLGTSYDSREAEIQD